MTEDMNELKTVEGITRFNEHLYNKYNRHHRLTDKTFLFDPTIEPVTYFYVMEDISGNCKRKFRVSINGQNYFLKKELQAAWLSDEEYLKEQLDFWTKEMEISYMLEDAGIKNTAKGFHIFIKRSYSAYSEKFRLFVWSLSEYVEGDTVQDFDYGAQLPYQFYDTPSYGRHKPGKLVSLSAAKEFCKELISVYISILKLGYLPYRYNDRGIVIRYDQNAGKIEWKFVDYLYFKETDFPNSYDIRSAIESINFILCYRMCVYTNHSTHEKLSEFHHPYWTKLSKMMTEKIKYFEDLGQQEYESYRKQNLRWDRNFPEISINECINTFTEIYRCAESD